MAVAQTEIKAGMAEAIWDAAWTSANGKKRRPSVPSGAVTAANDLSKLYAAENGDALLGLMGPKDDERDFGRRLAVAALHLGGHPGDAYLPSGIAVPMLKVSMRNDELRWEGGWRLPEKGGPVADRRFVGEADDEYDRMKPYHGPSEDYRRWTYDRWSYELGRAAAKTGARIAYGPQTHDAWKAGKTPMQYAKEAARQVRPTR